MIRPKLNTNLPKTNYEFQEGETIEDKVKRVLENNEPISDGAPIIYTDKKQGVIAAYNIRADRWEIAQAAMDTVNMNRIAKSKGTIKNDKDNQNNTDNNQANTADTTGNNKTVA